MMTNDCFNACHQYVCLQFLFAANRAGIEGPLQIFRVVLPYQFNQGVVTLLNCGARIINVLVLLNWDVTNILNNVAVFLLNCVVLILLD